MFSRKTRRIIVICLIAIFIIGNALYAIPWPTHINLSLNAAKVDMDGNILKYTEITIEGFYLNYLFKEDFYDISISPFDDLNWIKLTTDGLSERTGLVRKYSKDCWKISCYTYYGNCDLLFSKDFKYVAFNRHDIFESNAKYYYIATTDDTVPIEEAIEFFRYAPPFG